MQLQASKLLFIPFSLQKQQYRHYIPPQSLTASSQSSSIAGSNSNNSMSPYKSYQLYEFPVPLFSILFSYIPTQDFKGFEVDIDIQLMVKGQKIAYKLVEQNKDQMYLYKLIEIDSCICYQKLVTCLVTVKICQLEPNLASQILSVDQLSQLLSKRFVNLQSNKTVCTYKRQLIIKQPVTAITRYSSQGYIWLKVKNNHKSITQKNNGSPKKLENSRMKIQSIKLMNWCVGGWDPDKLSSEPYYEQVKRFQSQSSFQNLMKNGTQLEPEEQIACTMSINQNLNKIEIPYIIEYSVDYAPNHHFKLIKYATT